MCLLHGRRNALPTTQDHLLPHVVVPRMQFAQHDTQTNFVNRHLYAAVLTARKQTPSVPLHGSALSFPTTKASSPQHPTTTTTTTREEKRRELSMEKRMALGVRKKRPIKRNKKKLLNRVLHYLRSDFHMYAPLVSRPPAALTSSIKKTDRGVEVRKPSSEKKKLITNVCDYLKSNCYMYAPLLALPQSLISSPRGSSLYVEKVTTTFEVSKRKVVLKGYKPNEKSADGILEDHASKGSLFEENIKQQSSVLKEDAMKHMVHNRCRSSSMTGGGMLGSQITKLID